ncbi:hypothetical protein C0J52_24992 [Blattella germanica]|nr:hypothetical protein C0J52_24992 [Blattella germanica]
MGPENVAKAVALTEDGRSISSNKLQINTTMGFQTELRIKIVKDIEYRDGYVMES